MYELELVRVYCYLSFLLFLLDSIPFYIIYSYNELVSIYSRVVNI